MTEPLSLLPGKPWPLGGRWRPGPAAAAGAATAGGSTDSGVTDSGINFAVWAPDASRIELCLFDAAGREELRRVDLPCCSDGVWHGFLPAAAPGLVYGLRAHGPWAPQQGHRFNPAKVLLDPWAEEVVGHYGDGDLALHVGHDALDPLRPDARDNAATALKARVCAPLPSAPGRGPEIPAGQRVLYEAHVKALTMRHPDIPQALRGTYAGLAHPALVEHLQALGVTTLSLMPLHFRADEAALLRRGLVNHWGYSSIAWLAPETRYWSGTPGSSAAGELRAMVDTLHGAGIEVVLDVVYNHTAETDEFGPTLSLRGLANARYYHLDPAHPERYCNWTGCGNSVRADEPRVLELVLGSLRHWVEHYGIDGFRLDLATTLARARDGRFNPQAGFFAAIQADPVLARVKWIAEPWDIGPDGYQLGAFPPGWSEWNDQFRDTMRAWWLRGGSDRGGFAHRYAASSAQFRHNARGPEASLNFITAHDGFTLRDLVSYDHKHNEANGEHNRDGHHHNNSWNCGVEGASTDAIVCARRQRLQRALLATLLCAQGTPMLLAGDEFGHSQQGNNNAYCQDSPLTWLDWAAADHELLACTRRLLRLRRELAALRQPHWLQGADEATAADAPTVSWWHPQGRRLADSDWHAAERALGILLHAPASAAVLLLFNPDPHALAFTLPAGDWLPVFDNHQPDGAPAANPACASAAPPASVTGTLTLAARSLLIHVEHRPGASTPLSSPAETCKP